MSSKFKTEWNKFIHHPYAAAVILGTLAFMMGALFLGTLGLI